MRRALRVIGWIAAMLGPVWTCIAIANGKVFMGEAFIADKGDMMAAIFLSALSLAAMLLLLATKGSAKLDREAFERGFYRGLAEGHPREVMPSHN